MIDYQLIIL